MTQRIMVLAFGLLLNLFSLSALAQVDEKEQSDFKRKIDMAIRRLDMRIDKIDKDMKDATASAKETSGEYRAKLVKAKEKLEGDLKQLPAAVKSGWKEFKEGAEEHMAEAKESIKPVML